MPPGESADALRASAGWLCQGDTGDKEAPAQKGAPMIDAVRHLQIGSGRGILLVALNCAETGIKWTKLISVPNVIRTTWTVTAAGLLGRPQ